MSNIENYDGLCGIIANFATSDLQIRCHYEIGHQGPCSFEKHKNSFIIESSCRSNEYEEFLLNQKDKDGLKRGFINSVLQHKKK